MSLFSRDLRAHEFPPAAQWLNTSPLTLKDLEGRIVLLDFWTYCCINCMHVIPDLKRLEAKYPELVVVGVHSAKFHNEQVRDNIRHAILRYEIEHPVLVDNDFELWRAYGIRAWPSFVLIDPVGNVAGKASGEGVYDLFDTTIASLSAAFAEQGLLDTEPFPFDLVKERTPEAALSYPGKLEVDREGRRLFVTDSNHNRVVVFTPGGEVTDVVGSGAVGREDGSFEEASFFRPQGMAYDPRNDSLYVADTENHLVRRVDLAKREVTTVLGKGYQGGYANKGTGTSLALNSPWDLTIKGDHLYIAMAGPHQLWRMDLTTHRAERFAGSGAEDIVDGPRDRAALAQPSGITNDGERIFFADSEVSAVRMVEGDRVRTLVGAGLFDFGDADGPVGKARFQHPIGVTHHGGNLFVADTYNHKVKMIDLENGTVHTMVGSGVSGDSDGSALEAQLSEPNDVVLLDGNMFIADTNNHRIRVFDPASDRLFTFAFTNQDVLFPKPSRAKVGTRVDLPPAMLAPGEGKVHLRLTPPEGHEWNPEAPNGLEVVTDGDVVMVPPFAPGDWDWDYEIPLMAKVQGTAEVRFSLVAYFCTSGERGFCLYRALELVMPVTIEDGGPHEIEVFHPIDLD
jgi:DNA-binding beta-propeller fold protein YncE